MRQNLERAVIPHNFLFFVLLLALLWKGEEKYFPIDAIDFCESFAETTIAFSVAVITSFLIVCFANDVIRNRRIDFNCGNTHLVNLMIMGGLILSTKQEMAANICGTAENKNCYR